MTTGSELVVVGPEARALSKELALAQVLPQALRNKPADVLAVILTGAELGLAPLQALRGIHIIEGKASLSASLMVALCKRRSDVCEYFRLVKSDDTIATYETKRVGDPSPVEMSFTIAQAAKAGLTNKDNFKKYPAAMLRARCESALCKVAYSDLMFGCYDSDSGELDEPREVNPAPQAAHVDAVRSELRAQVAAPKPPDVVDGTFTTAPPEVTPPPATKRARRPGDVCDEACKPGSVICSAYTDCQNRFGLAGHIAAAKTPDDLKALGPALKAASPEEQATLRPVYKAKQAELTK